MPQEKKLKPREGFYKLTRADEPFKRPMIVYAYKCKQMADQWTFGINERDGGGLVLAKDIPTDTVITAVSFTEDVNIILSSK